MIAHLLIKIVKKLGFQALATMFLMSMVLGSLIWTLVNLLRELNFSLLLPMAMGGFLLAWALAARSQIPGWLAGLGLASIGIEWGIVQVTNMETLLLRLIDRLIEQILVAWWLGLEAVDPAAVWQSLQTAGRGFTTLGYRLADWSTGTFTGTPTVDPVASTLVWCVAIWLASAWAGWGIRRHRAPLPAILPTAVLLTTVLAYHPRLADNLIPLLGGGLLLCALMGYINLEQRWEAARLDVASALAADIGLAVLPLAAALMGLALLTPSISIQQMAHTIQQWVAAPAQQAEAVARSVGLNPDQADSPYRQIPYQIPEMPRRHLLGSGPELSRQVVMRIRPDTPPIEAPPRYYWRGLTYDEFTGWGWRTSKANQYDYAAGELVPQEEAAGRPHLSQQVEIIIPQNNILYAAGDPVTVDHPFSLNWRNSADLFGGSITAADYRVESLLPPPATPEQLRHTSGAIPDWVQQRYLQLPPTVTDRTLTLARNLTATLPTPYDRAKAIETYLRGHYTYNLTLPPIPAGKDLVDYFLFDLRQGYCDYYASAMVVLARAAGLPARLAMGFAGGEFDPRSHQYVVTAANAHSWAEVYFPGYGWLTFEPTSTQPLPQPVETGPADELAQNLTPPEATQPRSPGFGLDPRGWLAGGLAAVGLLLLAGGAIFMADEWRLRRMSPERAAAVVFGRLQRYGPLLGVTTHPGDTPYEFASAFNRRLATMTATARWRAPSPPDRWVNRLADLYVQTLFSPHRLTPQHQRELTRTWRTLSRRLWLIRWVQFFRGMKIIESAPPAPQREGKDKFPPLGG
jgi:transglutaminase-like putative cysteine protease